MVSKMLLLLGMIFRLLAIEICYQDSQATTPVPKRFGGYLVKYYLL